MYICYVHVLSMSEGVWEQSERHDRRQKDVGITFALERNHARLRPTIVWV